MADLEELVLIKKQNDFEQKKYELAYVEMLGLLKQKLLARYGLEAFKSWFQSLEFVSEKEGCLTLSAGTKFISDWISVNYIDVMFEIWKTFDTTIKTVFVVPEKKEQRLGSSQRGERDFFSESQNKTPSLVSGMTSAFSETKSKENFIYSSVSEQNTFENFVEGKPNEFACAACRKVSDNTHMPNRATNPLFLYGGVGLGKTHLMHAIVLHVRNTMPWKKVIYMTSENFIQNFVASLRENKIIELKKDLRSADILLIDDIQFIGGKGHSQEEFFHTFNDLISNGRQIVISADRIPNELQSVNERIKSRLGGGLMADIGNTTFELRMGILQKKIRATKMHVGDDVVEYLAKNVVSNVRELEGALNRVIQNSDLMKKKLNIDFVKENLKGLIKKSSYNTLTLEKIQEVVSERYGVSRPDLLSKKRDRNTLKARSISIYLSRKLTQMSLVDIGRRFGNKDHATVIHNVKKIAAEIKKNPDLKQEIESLENNLNFS